MIWGIIIAIAILGGLFLSVDTDSDDDIQAATPTQSQTAIPMHTIGESDGITLTADSVD